jgi:hypothetical protein
MIVLSVIDDAVKGLQSEPNPMRVRKLMLYACTGTWESNLQRLQEVSWRQLVEQLWTTSPTLDQLRSHLYDIVHTLNKPAEYTLVANAILKHLNELYLIEQHHLSAAQQSQYQAIAQQIEQGQDALRAKKLLFCACKNSWQNDPSVLSQFPLSGLVEQLHNLAPTAQSLDDLLNSIVRTLNRQMLYQRVTQSVLNAFHPLYASPADLDSTQVNAPTTQIITPTTQIVTTPGADPPAVVPNVPSPPAARHLANDVTVAQESATPAQPELLDMSVILDALFDLRLEVMKYTNPLRAKLLIFCCVREPIADVQRAVKMARSHELGDLLKELILAYPSFTLLDERLRAIAHQMTDLQQYSQAASAVLRAVKPIYDRFPDGVTVLQQVGRYDGEVTEMNASAAEPTGLLIHTSNPSDPSVSG